MFLSDARTSFLFRMASPPVSSDMRLSIDWRLFRSTNVSMRWDVVRFSALMFESTETPDAFAAWMTPRYFVVRSNSNRVVVPLEASRYLSETYFQSSAPGDCGRPPETWMRILRQSTDRKSVV